MFIKSSFKSLQLTFDRNSNICSTRQQIDQSFPPLPDFFKSMSRTLVHYVIPEDGDDFEHPNVFAVQIGLKRLAIKDVVDKFPLPGEYHFRFKSTFKKTFVWEDAVDFSAPVPTYQGQVSLKVSRLRPAKASSNSNESFGVEVASSPPSGFSEVTEKVKASPKRRKNSDEDLLNMLGNDNDTLIEEPTFEADFQSAPAVGRGASTSSYEDSDLMGVDFGSSPVNAPPPPMMNNVMGRMGAMNGSIGQQAQYKQSAPPPMNTTMKHSRTSSLASDPGSVTSKKGNSPRSSAIADMMQGGFKL